MSEVERAFHETWLGMVQPEGLVVSIPVLIDKECFERHPPALHYQFRALCGLGLLREPANDNGRPTKRRKDERPEEAASIRDLPQFLAELLGLTPDLWDAAQGYRTALAWAGTLPAGLSVFAPEGRQTIRPTLALRRQGAARELSEADGELAHAAAAYELLLWELPDGLALDKNETVTGTWEYPPAAKLERLLRAARVPIGIVTNGQVLRLIYAPHGEATGHVDFRLADMAEVGGRPMLDALVMLLHARRFFAVAEDRALPAILAESRKYQANVTNQLGEQVFEALTILLRGFEAAAERDGQALLEQALARENDHLVRGLLTVLLRMVFVLFAEDRELLPIEHPLYQKHYSLFALYDRLQADHGAFPDSMARRFGAWGQLIALFRALYCGASHGELKMPARRGALFNPNVFAFLEGWDPEGTAPIGAPALQAEVKLPTLDDETVFLVLHKLILLDGQRLSYRSLDVEQIGSVYEGLLGFHVVRVPGKAVRMRPDGVWLTAEEALAVPAARRAAFLADHVNLPKAQAKKLADALNGLKQPEAAYEVLQGHASGRTKEVRAGSCARPGQLVLQPGRERRRTSSHYTPRSLASKVVDRTLEPLLRCMTEEGQQGPASERILQLRVCDPAVGSGAFLVEACRYLGDALVAAWTREGRVAQYKDPETAARRRIAQCCLYGVDKNPAAVELTKLSLWLVTLSKQRPFTFLDGNLRHGDSLVGLSLDQLRAFHWKPTAQCGLAELRIEEALREAIGSREKLRELAQKENGINPDPGEKQLLLRDADDALERLRLIADVCVGAFFACDSERARENERLRRRDLVEKWLSADGGRAAKLEAALRELQAELRRTQVPFHWMLEFPDVFWDERKDPLDPGAPQAVAHMDAFVGNPPFMGGTGITSVEGSPSYALWLKLECPEASTTTDLCAYFFRRGASLLGSHGAMGFVATNSIAEGDTRVGGLLPVLRGGGRILHADTDLAWPGSAAVRVSVMTVGFGLVASSRFVAELNGFQVPAVNSRLEPERERPDPTRLSAQKEASFVGTSLGSNGFVLDPAEADELLGRYPNLKEVIMPLIGGKEVVTNPGGNHDRFVINFRAKPLAYAEQFPAALQIVKERVKPARDKGKSHGPGMHGKKYWWQHTLRAEPLYRAISDLKRCLVVPEVAKHLCFAFQPTAHVFTKQLFVFPFSDYTPFAVLQSRIHEAWARLLSSTMEDRLRYAASDCFETFPFPQPDPRTPLPKLEKLGEKLYDARDQYMLDTQQGLTKTYNALKDPACGDRRILTLRALHEAMDAAVLDEYGWSDLKVPPLCAKTAADTRAQETFKNKVIDRLYDLNAERAQEEERKGLGSKKKGKLKTLAKAAKKPLDHAAEDDRRVAARSHGPNRTAARNRAGIVSTRPSAPLAKAKRSGGSR